MEIKFSIKTIYLNYESKMKEQRRREVNDCSRYQGEKDSQTLHTYANILFLYFYILLKKLQTIYKPKL